jgi:hypothetical protein
LDPGAPSRRSIPALHLVAPFLALHPRARPIPLYRAPGWRAIPARRPWPCRFSVSQPLFGNRARRPWPIQGGRLGPAPPAQAYAASFGLRACTL